MTSFPPLLVRTVAAWNLFEGCFQEAKNDTVESLESQNWERFREILASFNRTAIEKRLFITSGSFYPALAVLMRKGNYQVVLDAIDQTNGYEDLITPEIQICKAGCLWKLGKQKESVKVFAAVEKESGLKFNTMLKRLFFHAEVEEKQIYEDLLMNFKALSLD